MKKLRTFSALLNSSPNSVGCLRILSLTHPKDSLVYLKSRSCQRLSSTLLKTNASFKSQDLSTGQSQASKRRSKIASMMSPRKLLNSALKSKCIPVAVCAARIGGLRLMRDRIGLKFTQVTGHASTRQSFVGSTQMAVHTLNRSMRPPQRKLAHRVAKTRHLPKLLSMTLAAVR